MARMEQPGQQQGWRKKSTVTVLYSYSYKGSSKGSSSSPPVSMKEGERLILMEKSNADWWQVRRPGDKSQAFYAPANYLHEDGLSRQSRKGPAPSLAQQSRSDDSLRSNPSSRVGQLTRKQRSSSMDATMFLELLDGQQTLTPAKGSKAKAAESLADKLKKPRISKDLWERRKSWAVEELQQQQQQTSSSSSFQRFPALKESSSTAPPLPPRSAGGADSKTGAGPDKTAVQQEDKAPALPPKKSQTGHNCVASSPDNYSRVTRLKTANSTSPAAAAAVSQGGTRLSESLEKLAQQIQTPLSYPHPVPPPRRTAAAPDSMGQSTSSHSPPQLPPKDKALTAKGSIKRPPAASTRCKIGPALPRFLFTQLVSLQVTRGQRGDDGQGQLRQPSAENGDARGPDGQHHNGAVLGHGRGHSERRVGHQHEFQQPAL